MRRMAFGTEENMRTLKDLVDDWEDDDTEIDFTSKVKPIILSFKSGVNEEKLEWLRAHRPVQTKISPERAAQMRNPGLKHSEYAFIPDGDVALTIENIRDLLDIYQNKNIPCLYCHKFCNQGCKSK